MELSLGLWLWMSPFTLRHEASHPFLWGHDLTIGSVIIALALISHWRPLQRAYLAELPIALWLMGIGWWSAWRMEAIVVDAA